MATKKEQEKEELTVDLNALGEEYVEFMIPRTGPDDKAVFIGVNGEAIRVKPGVQVRVKRKFVEAWENSKAQEREAWQTQDRAAKASRKALADL